MYNEVISKDPITLKCVATLPRETVAPFLTHNDQ